MSNPYYSPGQARVDRVQSLFATIARRYDVMNDLQSLGLHRRWKRRLIRMARILPGERVLDLCCGTGDLALASAACGASVVGMDFSEPMLAVARFREQRLSGQGGASEVGSASDPRSPNPQFLLGDAMKTGFPDDSFAVITVGYGLRNLADLREGLQEMRRLVRPGGRLLTLDFAKPKNALWRALYFSYLKIALPILGWMVCGDAAAYGYILESLKHYPAQEGVARAMQEAGLTNVRFVNLLGGVMAIHYAEKPRLQ